VSDAALADAIVARLRVADLDDRASPQFIFAMSMENHGPLHLETVAAGESSAWHELGDDAQWRDLTAYLRHLKSADDMIGRLLNYLRTRQRETVLCFYGDHVPALGHVFDALGQAPARSQYFIWRNFGDIDATQASIDVVQLGMAVRHALRAGRRQIAASGL
jgi:phosphoglycerol transferase MdoB-like AlkP superfamily enzyme